MPSALLALALLILVPAGARAATVSVIVEEYPGHHGVDTAMVVEYEAGPGETNDLGLRVDGSTLQLDDPGAVIAPGAGCVADGAHVATCTVPGIEAGVTARLGDGNDRVRAAPAAGWYASVWGGDGDDVLDAGTSFITSLVGEGGDDRLTSANSWGSLSGGDGDDVLTAGNGSDDLDGGFGDDVIDAGGGRDVLSYPRTEPVTVDLAAGTGGAPGEHDRLTGIEAVRGGNGPDLLLGSPGADSLEGGFGPDRLDGRGGNDRLHASDGADTVIGGAGDDLLDAGRGDDVLDGGAGNDRLAPWSGGSAGDRLACGSGADSIAAPRIRGLAPLPADCELLESRLLRLRGWRLRGRRLHADVGVGYAFQYGGSCTMEVTAGRDAVRLRRVRKGQFRPVRLRVPARGPVMLRVREAGHCNGVNPPMHVPLARR